MIFLYKLALRHPSFIGKKITAQLESVLEIKMKNLFQDSANREENQKFYTQYLFFSEHFREANPFQRYKILLVVLKCRGLLRTLLYLIPLPDHEVPLDLHASKRMYILKTLFRKRAIFFNEIISRLKVLYPTTKDLKLAPLVTNIMQFNLIELAVHQGKKMIYFDTQNGEPPIFGCANPTKIPKMEAFFHKLMSWDSRSVAAFVVKKQMQDISKRYFDEVYPHIHFGSDDFQSMQIRVLPRFDEVLGFDSTVQFQSRHQIFESVQIWHQRFIISKKELLVHDSTSHPKQKFVAGQWHFVKSFEEGENRCLIRRVLGETKHLDSGIFLSGRCDENWYHFILDTVPRILFVNDVPKDVPLLIRSDIPEHSKAVLATITDREIIEIKPNEILEVQNLYVVP